MRFDASIVITAAALAAACVEADPNPVPPEAFCEVPSEPGALAPLESHRFVAHAGGSPRGLLQEELYTNSREAFEVSYRNGFRVFELDLILLADGEVLVAHDFHEDEYGLRDGTFPSLTRPELEGRRWRGKYELLFGDDLIALMVEHPDVWIVLDTKLDGHVAIAEALVALAPDDGVRDRMVPHLASEEHAAALDAIHRFPERMIAMYRWGGNDAQLVDDMQRLGIDDVMMWWDRRWSEEVQAAVEAIGGHVWVHTPEDPAVLEEFVDRGVGVYSDGWIRCVTD